MVPLRGKGSESQDRLIFKEEFIMYEDIITKGSLVTTKNENGEVCLLGKLEWHLNYKDRELGIIKHSHISIIFNRLECIEAMEMFRIIKEIKRCIFEDNNKKYYLINEDGIKIHVSDDTSFKHFQKAIRNLFGFAISEMAENGVSVKINVSTEK